MRLNKIINQITEKRHGYLLPPLVSGILLIFAFPRFDQGYLAWAALVPMLWICLQVKPGQAFRAGFVFGLPFTIYLNMYLAVVLYPYLPDYLASLAMILLFAYISLFYAVFALGANLAGRPGNPWYTALAVPSLWLLVEYIRSFGLLGYNVGYLGYTQWGYPFLLNIASVYGYWGLPFLMVLLQALLVLYLQGKLRHNSLYAAAAVFTGLLAAGLLLPLAQTVERKAEPLQTGLIQGNTHPEEVVDYSRDEVLTHYLDLTREALDNEPELDLVVWPETVVHLDYGDEKKHLPQMTGLAKEHKIDLLYGVRVREEGHLYNSITLYSKNQAEIPVYHKQRLVPFAEYFPAEDLLNRILQLDLLLGSYTPGEKITLFDLNGTKVAGVVCFESYFGNHMRLFANKGARHLFVVTNDAWFGESIGLEQHAQAAAIRAAEAGVGVTQAANSGITISFDYQGRELLRSGKNKQAIFNLPLDMAYRKTIYSRFGEYFPAAWAAFLVIASPAILVKARRESS
ncbi:MAG: apolipoprotein N-acyltransferase [Bacillota bacterium]